MGAQVINLWRRDVDQSGTTSTIIMVGQGVTGPRGADGAGVSVATKESGTEKVAVTTVLDFLAGFDVAGAAGVASVSVDLTEYSGGALPVAGGGTGATDASGARTNLGLGTAATTAASAYATAAQGATADTAVQPTLVDVKGDLLVGSAADTLARLPVGTNDYVLTADSAEATGVKWAAASGGGGGGTRPGNAAKSGTTYWGFTPDIVYHMQASTNAVPGNNVLWYIPMWVPQRTRITAMAVRPQGGTAGAGRAAHVGIYAADLFWQPTGAPLTDNTISCVSEDWNAATGLTVDLEPGPYLKCIVVNNGTTRLELRRMGPIIGHTGGSTMSAGHIYNPRVAFTYAALPSTPTPWDTVDVATDTNTTNNDFVAIQFAPL